MKYQGVNIDTKCEWVLSRLQDADGYVYRTTLEDEMLSHKKFTVSKFRTAINKIEALNFVKPPDTEPTEGGINDKKLYKLNSTVLEQYLDAKEEQGLERGLSSPIQSEGVGKVREALVEEREERRRLESDLRELRSELELLQSHFNARGSERIARIEEIQQDYLMEHTEVEKQRWDALERLLEEQGFSLDDYA